MSKADVKNLDQPWRARIAAAVERALQLAGTTQKEAWVLLGHADGARVSRWCNGTERPQFEALFAVDEFRQPLAQALAEMAGAEVAVTVTIRRNG